MKIHRILSNLALIFALSIALISRSVYAAPPAQPATFWGLATIGGSDAPVGSIVSVWRDESLLLEATVQLFNGNSVYAVTVPEDDPATPQMDGGNEGVTLTFKLNGQPTQQSTVWQSGTSTEVNLSVAQAQPLLVSVSPAFGDAGNSVEVSLVGANTHFVNGNTTAAFGSGITVEQLTVTSATEATAHLTIASNATQGQRTVSLSTGSETVSLANAFTVRGPGLDVSFPTVTAVAGLPVEVALIADDDLTNHDILSLFAEISYDPDVLEFVEVSQAGTLLGNWPVEVNEETTGHIVIASYNASPIVGSGTLVKFRFNAIGSAGSASDLLITQFTFNEGTPGATPHNGQVSIDGLTIAGLVSYRGNGRPVDNTTIAQQGPVNQETTTLANGTYTTSPGPAGIYILTPQKQDELGLAISALDAAWLAQCAVGKRAASACPAEVSDISGDGNVGVYDAALIARFLVGFGDANPIGIFQFDPPYRTYQPLQTSQDGQDYVASKIGDVTANWGEEASVQVSGVTSAPTLALASVQAMTGATVAMPVTIQGVVGADIVAYELTVRFDAQRLSFHSVSEDGSAEDGSVGDNFELISNVTEPGLLKIVGYGVDALSADGVLLKVNFTTLDKAGDAQVKITTARLNEDAPTANVSAAVVHIDPQPTAPTQSARTILMPLVQR